jgi:hypothetical protein
LKRNENENMKLHLMYLSLIFGIISLGLLALVFVESTTAITSLSYASTLLSIVLAVIAILITLWDVAGQKNTIFEIKSETDKLKATVEDLREAYSGADDIIERIKTLQDYLVGMINDNNKLSHSILDSIENIKDSKDDDEKFKQIEELEKKVMNSVNTQNANYKRLDNLVLDKFGMNYQDAKEDVLSYVRTNYKEKRFTANEVVFNYYQDNNKVFPPLVLSNVLKELQNDGHLQRVKENGEIYYKFY